MHSDCIAQLKWLYAESCYKFLVQPGESNFLEFPSLTVTSSVLCREHSYALGELSVVCSSQFSIKYLLGKASAVLIGKVRPSGAVGGVAFWTVLNWCSVLLFSSLWTMWFMMQLAQERLRNLTSEANHWGMPWLEGCWKEKERERKRNGTDYISSKRSFHGRLGNRRVVPMISFSVCMCNCFSWLAFLRDDSRYEEGSALPAP